MNELTKKITQAIFEGTCAYYVMEVDNRGNITDMIRCKDEYDQAYTVVKYGKFGYTVESAYGNGIHVSIVTAPMVIE